MNYLDINKNSWNNKVDIHYNSDFYENDLFIKGQSSLRDIELALLGDIKGKSILHLQCHFGQDTISLHRLGAQSTGVDLSDKGIEKARQLATLIGVDVDFICCDIYDLPQHLDKQFDIVFTSYGTIGWLPDINKWANIVSRFLKPKGQFIFVEFHPVVWMYDDDFKKITYNYFNDAPIVESEEGTYANKSAEIKLDYVMWNHGIGEVVNSLIKERLEINDLQEYDYAPYNFMNDMEAIGPRKFRITGHGNKIPLVYSIVATKK